MTNNLNIINCTQQEFRKLYGISESDIAEWYGADVTMFYWVDREDDDAVFLGAEREDGTFSVYGAGYDRYGLTETQMKTLLMSEFGA